MYSLGKRTPACALPSCSFLTYTPLLIGTGFLPDWPTAQRLACLVRLNIGVKGLHHSWKMQISFVYAHAYLCACEPCICWACGGKGGCQTLWNWSCRHLWAAGVEAGTQAWGPCKSKRSTHWDIASTLIGQQGPDSESCPRHACNHFHWRIYFFIGLAALSPIFDLCIVGIVLDP